MYAEIVINTAVRNTFDYHIPPELDGQVQVGQLVQIAFGTAMQHGIVLNLHESSAVEQTKPILEVMDSRPVVTPPQIEIARWIAEHYLMPLGPCLWLWLPPGLANQHDLLVTLLNAEGQIFTPLEQKIVDLLKRRNPRRGYQLTSALTGEEWRPVVDALAKIGVLKRENILAPPRVRPKMIRTVTLAIHPDQIASVARHLGRESRRANLLEVIAASNDDMRVEDALRIAGVGKPVLAELEKDGLVTTNRDSRESKDDPITITLNIPSETVDENLIALRKGERFLKILRVLARENAPMDVSWLYAQADATLPDLKKLEEEGLILLGEEQTWRDSLANRDYVPTAAPALTSEQRMAWEPIEAKIKSLQWDAINPTPALPEFDPEQAGRGLSNIFLLHGVTGSGKTEIYLRAIELTLAQGRQIIYLVPEVALTPQTIRRVTARFPGRVAVVHGTVSQGERYDTWRRARENLVQIVVGARSALFTPFPDVGLIILDEEHDESYKQDPDFSQLSYHARRVAEEMARNNNAVLILGDATPDLETSFRAHRGDIGLLQLPRRIMGHRTRILEQSEREGVLARYYPSSAEDALMIDLPPVEVVDMRTELKSGNTSIFSRSLQDEIATALERREQIMLFLNRRGKNTYVFCRDCGYVDKCPRCDVPMTYHQYDEMMRCHLCGYSSKPRTICPACQSKRIKYFGAGTEQVEQELIRLFPMARVVRWDADTARTSNDHDGLLRRFIERKADVMIGTKMVAKGLDLPLVTLVGVVNADVGLGLPDFRSAERTFQILTQVVGRAGRGLLGGKAIIQTYLPEHYVIQAAAEQDYESFYEQEMAYRRELGYPPLRRMLRVVFQFPTEVKAKAEAERAAAILQRRIEVLQLTGTQIMGPAPCFFARINNVYRWHVILRGPNPVPALEGVDIGRGWYVDIDPVDLL